MYLVRTVQKKNSQSKKHQKRLQQASKKTSIKNPPRWIRILLFQNLLELWKQILGVPPPTQHNSPLRSSRQIRTARPTSTCGVRCNDERERDTNKATKIQRYETQSVIMLWLLWFFNFTRQGISCGCWVSRGKPQSDSTLVKASLDANQLVNHIVVTHCMSGHLFILIQLEDHKVTNHLSRQLMITMYYQ